MLTITQDLQLKKIDIIMNYQGYDKSVVLIYRNKLDGQPSNYRYTPGPQECPIIGLRWESQVAHLPQQGLKPR